MTERTPKAEILRLYLEGIPPREICQVVTGWTAAQVVHAAKHERQYNRLSSPIQSVQIGVVGEELAKLSPEARIAMRIKAKAGGYESLAEYVVDIAADHVLNT